MKSKTSISTPKKHDAFSAGNRVTTRCKDLKKPLSGIPSTSMAVIVRFRNILSTHWLALGAALAVALLILAPIIATPLVLGRAYQGVDLMHYGSDELIYLSRAQDALEGHGTAQPYIGQNKNELDPTFSFAEVLLTAPLWALHRSVDIVSYYNVLNFVGVFCLVLLMYGFALLLSGDRIISLAAATFPITGYAIIEAHTIFYGGYDIYGRSVFPYISSLILFGFLLSIYYALEHKKRYVSVAVAGTLLGLSCWIYLYLWTYLFAFVVVLAMLYALLKHWDELRTTLLIGGIGAVLGGCNILRLLLFVKSMQFSQTAYFYASIKSHAPVWSNEGFATLILLCLTLYFKPKTRATFFIAALIATGWVVFNQQVLSGIVLQYGHYFWYFVSPLSIIVALLLLQRLFPLALMRAGAAALVVVGFLNLVGQQSRAFAAELPQRIAEQKFMPIMQALRNEPQGSVLTAATSDNGPFFVSIYTDDDLYWIPAAENHSFSPQMLEEALLVHLYLNKESRQNPIAYLRAALAKHDSSEITYLYTEWEGYNSGFDYYGYERRFAADDPALGSVRDKLMGKIAQDYPSVATPLAVQALMRERQVRYVLWDKMQAPDWDLSVLGPIDLVATSTDLYLYKIQ